MAQRASRAPGRFTGYDLSQKAIDETRRQARELGNTNVEFTVRDLIDFDRTAEPASFDLITTFDAVHDQADPLALLRDIRRALADGGVYLAQDIKGSSHHHTDRDHPIRPLLYTLSCMHCMTVSLARGGEGLGAMYGRASEVTCFVADPEELGRRTWLTAGSARGRPLWG